jgi:hypothetical protein
VSFQADTARLPFCCGFNEAGYFTGDDDTEFNSDSAVELVEELIHEANGRPLIFNFVGSSPEEIVAAVKNHPDVLYLGHWTNPGTYNRIDSYIIKNNMTTAED